MLRWLLMPLASVILLPFVLSEVNPQTTLECHRRDYTYKATRTDPEGRKCWDYLSVKSCWGRCDSYEIADWRFPFKLSIHPVCIHEETKLQRVILSHCDPEVDVELRYYEYVEAVTCSCQLCDSSTTSCESPHRGPIPQLAPAP